MLLHVVSLFFLSFLCTCYTEKSYLEFTEDPLQELFGKVIFASMLFRHGDRTVNNPYPTDPYQLSFWELGKEQLTKIGKLHEYQLGKWARQRYGNLVLGKPYKYDFLLVNSSDTDRTLMSAELFLAGFYPPSENEMWNHEGLQWQPIPVHTVPRPMDNVIALDRECEKYKLEEIMIFGSQEFSAYYEEHRTLFEYVSTHTGWELSKDDIKSAMSKLWDVYDDLFIEDQNNLTLPKWTKSIYPEPLKSVGEFGFSMTTYSREMQRLKGGPLVKSILEDMIEKRDNSMWNRTFHLYSGHDVTVAALLDTLRIYNRIAPPYCAAVIVELRQMDDEYFVTVLYRNSSDVAPFLLQIPGCEKKACSLDEFIRATIPIIPDDWEYECQLGFLMKLYYFTYFDLIVLGCIILALTISLVIICRLHVTRTRRYKHYQVIQESVLNPDVKNSA